MTQVLADGPPAVEALTYGLAEAGVHLPDRQEFSLGQAAPVSASNALMADPIVG